MNKTKTTSYVVVCEDGSFVCRYSTSVTVSDALARDGADNDAKQFDAGFAERGKRFGHHGVQYCHGAPHRVVTEP